MQRVPFQEIINGFERKYGSRNRTFMRDRGEIVLFHSNAQLCLRKQIRSGDTPKRHIAVSLGSVFSRTIALANSFGSLPIVDAMCTKYPMSGCAYCESNPCECEHSKRNQIQEHDPDEFQLYWSIWDWCRHLKKVYGVTNRERGIEVALSRLTEEFLEVSDAEFVARHKITTSNNEFREEISKEFADVFAWIFSISNLLEINLDGIAKAWAFKKCSECRNNPCDCGPFRFL